MPRPAEPRLSAVLVGLALGAVLFAALATARRDFEPGDFGLGHNTTRAEASRDGRVLSGHHREATRRVMESFGRFRGEGRAVALWLGASQLHAINAYEPGDALAVEYAGDAARASGRPLVFLQASRGNANLRELLALYLAFRQRGLVPEHLIVALVYDDLGEDGLRRGVLELLEPFDASALPLRGEARRVAAEIAGARDALAAAAAEAGAPIARNAVTGTPQDRLEGRVVRALEDAFDAYDARGRLASWLELRSRLALRRAVLSVKQGFRVRRLWRPTDAVPVPAALAERNLRALDALVELATADGVRLTLYRQPHRPGQEPFYHHRAAYDAFFETVAARHGERARIADLETLVPADAYGLNNGLSPDVFHFADLGHRRLGRAVYELVVGGPTLGMRALGSGDALQ